MVQRQWSRARVVQRTGREQEHDQDITSPKGLLPQPAKTSPSILPQIFIIRQNFFFFFQVLFKFIYLCMAVLSLHFCARAFSSCGKRGHSSSGCAGLSLWRPLLLQSTGSRRTGSVVVAHGLSCSATCGIFPDQGSNPCPLHWQADSQPLRHQGSPRQNFLKLEVFFLNFLGRPSSLLAFFCLWGRILI